MAHVVKDRVKEITSSTGTGSVTLGGAPTSYQSFSSIGNGNTTFYTILDANGTGYASVDPTQISVIDYVGEQTRLWWGTFLKGYYLDQIETQAQAAADAARQAGLNAMANNPLFAAPNQ